MLDPTLILLGIWAPRIVLTFYGINASPGSCNNNVLTQLGCDIFPQVLPN